jgi:hypothetical protein
MERRHLVRAGLGCGLVALAGCLGTFSDTSSSDDETSGSADDGVLTDEPADEPVEQIVFGDADGTPSRVTVRNDGDDERTMAVRLYHDGDLVHDRTDDVPAAGSVEFVLGESGTYGTHLETGTARTETAVEHAGGDCEATHTVIAVTESGTLTRTETNC